MQDHDQYLFHQTPENLVKELIKYVPLSENMKVLEPFRGEGAFYNNFPENIIKDWTEIKEGKDYKDYDFNTNKIDWVITNPPFRIEKKNALWLLIDFFSQKVNKGIAFLVNDRIHGTLTPLRLQILKDRGFYINKIVVCSVKKWRGRYFFIIIEKKENMFINYLLPYY